MMLRSNRLFLVAATAAVALVGSAQFAFAAKAKPAARGVVSKVDAAAKTFVVTNKTAGDVTVSYSDKTVFKKAAEDPTAAPTDATAADLKEKARVTVQGTLADGKVQATEVTFGARRKKKAAQ